MKKHLFRAASLALAPLLSLFIGTKSIAQNLVPNTPAAARATAFEQRKDATAASFAAELPARAIGPAIFSCRVTDIDVRPDDPTHFLVAYASGGLWKTESNGARFEPLFDQEAVMTIGDIAVDWAKNVIWVGTGECNSSRSSYAGNGMYRSDDGGKTWQHRGLDESQHVARVRLDPKNPDVVWVAALGHLYSPNAERGIFKTSDGGKTWRNTLFVNENTGAIDVIVDPSNPQNLWAATWEKERRAWNFRGSGAGSAIWKSTDGGETWQKSSGEKSGFPTGDGVGRIGLELFQKDGKTVLFAVLDNQNAKPKKADDKKDEDPTALKKDLFRTISKADFEKLDAEKLDAFLRKNDFPEKYDSKKVKKMVADGKIEPRAFIDFLESDANANLFETEVIGAELYRSDDLGLTWKKVNADFLDGLFYTYGYYFASLAVDPSDEKKVYLMGVPIVKSDDGGQTFKSINGKNVHADHHFLWVNPTRKGHLINGNDGGVNMSYDDGKSWFKLNSPPVAQFYAINVDQAEPYNVYGGAQDNGVWTGSSKSEIDDEWLDGGQNPYKFLLGGDGMQVMIDPRDNMTVYTGSQFGFYSRLNKNSGDSKFITPQHDLGERPHRWNWQAPIWLSAHNPDVFYMGAQKVFRSLDRGDHFEAISGDLTGGSKKGNVPFGTLTCLHESPLKFGLLAAGSDDGLIHVSRDGGETWKKCSDALPQNLWVSRVQFSAHEKGRLYATLNGYRWDDFRSYLYVSENYGETWRRLGENLPLEPLNVVKEDPTNADLLFVGSDHAAYFSLDRGTSFQRLSKSMPAVPVHDMVIQKKARELAVGTHGRGIFIIDIAHLEELKDDLLTADLSLFEIKKKRFSANWGKSWNKFMPVKDPELPITFFAKTAGEAVWKVKIKDGGLIVQSGKMTVGAGLNTLNYDVSLMEKAKSEVEKAVNLAASKDQKSDKKPSSAKPFELKKADTEKFYLPKGSYIFELEKGGKSATRDFEIFSPEKSGEPLPYPRPKTRG